MSITTDKRKVNFIIACGYCLFVIVILFNYLTKTSKRSSYREGTRRAHENAEISTAGNDLENQLNEQKRMNKEMREMLIDIQNAKNNNAFTTNNKKAVPSNSSVPFQNTSQSNTPKNLTVKPLEFSSASLPEIDLDIEKKFKKNVVCPFNLDRNPFASPEAGTEVADVDDTINFPGHSVICNPILPYVFSSSNSDYRVISNY
ncbi:MAG: hypothetical protein IKO19_07675 [Candidatus Riflebacteria bacterium]|nr:hypothetical protein [Candidatus Riflebacteria bacterium]